MQAIFENKDKKSNGGEANLVSIVLYIGGISGYVERKYIGRFGIRESKI